MPPTGALEGLAALETVAKECRLHPKTVVRLCHRLGVKLHRVGRKAYVVPPEFNAAIKGERLRTPAIAADFGIAYNGNNHHEQCR